MQHQDSSLQRYSDEELRHLELSIGDPTLQSGVVWKIPKGAEIDRIINMYQHPNYPDEKVKCIKCMAKRHSRGFTALLTTGEKVLLGSSCGQKHFGKSWRHGEKDLKSLLDRKRLLLWFDKVSEGLEKLSHALCKWRPQIQMLRSQRKYFISRMPLLYQRLREAALQKSGSLELYHKVRDYHAEALGDGDDKSPIYKWNSHEFHRMKGAEFLLFDDPYQGFEHVLDVFEDVVNYQKDTREYSTGKLKYKKREFRKALKWLEELIGFARSFEIFGAPDQLKTIAEWATVVDSVPGNFSASGKTLYSSKDDVTMEFDANIKAIDLSPLTQLQDISTEAERVSHKSAAPERVSEV